MHIINRDQMGPAAAQYVEVSGLHSYLQPPTLPHSRTRIKTGGERERERDS
jgi:hypothetical protein